MPPLPLPMTPAELFAELDLHRLDNDWTFDELAAAMKRAGYPIPMRTVHYLLKQAGENVRPLDRTMHKIRRYLEYVRETKRRRRARKTAANKAAHTASA